jgi:hypothetical protein
MSNERSSMVAALGVMVGIVAAAGCGSLTKPNPLSCLDGYCSDQAHPFCDVDGSFSGKPGLCVAVACMPRTFEACRGDDAIVCNATGDDYDIAHCDLGCSDAAGGCLQCEPNARACDGGNVRRCDANGLPAQSEQCNFGCIDAPTAHCAYLEPKYLPSICDEPAATDLSLATAVTFDTSLDTNCNGGVVTQSDGPPICVARYRTINLKPAAVVTVTGARALALVADELLAVEGTLDISATQHANGPGGGTVVSGGPSGPFGGGGAGMKTAGAAGGNGTQPGGAANGGAQAPNPATLAVLVGGRSAATIANTGGGGGGAATLIACRGEVAVSGVIDAGGGGGTGGFPALGVVPAGGGGSGGNVVLQGMMVRVTGELFANGGGGGAGIPMTQFMGANGADGSRYVNFGALGGAAQDSEGYGGPGGCRANFPGAGGNSTAPTTTGGGGGGSVGFIQTYTPVGVEPRLSPTAVSPALEPSGTSATR